MPTPQREPVNDSPVIQETPQDLSTIPAGKLSVTPFGTFPFGEPFEFVSDVPIGAGSQNVGSVDATSYAIEYSAGDGRTEIRNLLADTFQINNNNNDQPSPGPSFPLPEEVTNSEFISIDTRPILASDVSNENTTDDSTIDSYTGFLSRPDLWRPTDGGVFEVANIDNLKHFSILPPQETRMAESLWPGTVVGYATGFIDKNNPTKIINVEISFEGQPTTCNGVQPGYTVVYAGDLVHDRDKAATATNGYIQRNTRVDTVSGTTYILNKPHTYTGEVGIAHTFTVRRIGPSKIAKEYGYYYYHYEEGSPPTSPEDFKLDKEYTSEYSYAFYYGKKPDGNGKTGSSALGAAGVDGNTSRYTAYNTTGRWGIYIDDEVKNYIEGRTFIGHNQGIGVGAATATINGNANTKVQPDPILSVFNNRFKNQTGELDLGSTACPGTQVGPQGDYNFDQYQMGLYVEDIAAIGTRPDIRYRLSVDGTATGAGILAKFTSATVPKAAKFKGDVDVTGTVTATSLSGDGTNVSNVNASTVGGTSAGSFLRSDAADQKTSGTLRFNDNVVLSLGTGDDAELFCNGSHLYLDLNSGIGNFYIRDGTTTRFTFVDAGDFTATGNVTAYSDITLKKDIEIIPNALDKVMELRGVTFKRVDLDDKKYTGVIAQEVEKVLPEVVQTDENGIKSVAYGNMVGLLIEAIKELKEEVNELRNQLNKE